MVNISTILAALFLTTGATTPFASAEMQETKTEISQSNFVLGQEMISSLRQAYEKGEYKDFLSQMDADYSQALANNELEGLVEMRKAEIPADFQAKWEDKVTQLQEAKNKDLLAALPENDNSVFAEKVRSLAANLSTPEQEKAITHLQSLVHMVPNMGANDDENKLIALDLEYEYKSLHSSMTNSGVSPQERRAYQAVLRMEKMDKMVAASKSFQDHSLKQAVGLAAANLDARLSRNIDGADLNAFVKGKTKPSNATEEKVSEVLRSYQEQFGDLMKEISTENR